MAEPSIVWANIAKAAQGRWRTASDMRRDLKIGQQTTMKLWHGESVGVITYLKVCRACKLDPMANFHG